MDAIYFNLKSNGEVLNRASYVVLGIDLEGFEYRIKALSSS